MMSPSRVKRIALKSASCSLNDVDYFFIRPMKNQSRENREKKFYRGELKDSGLLFDRSYDCIKKMLRTDGQTDKSFLYLFADPRLFGLWNMQRKAEKNYIRFIFSRRLWKENEPVMRCRNTQKDRAVPRNTDTYTQV